MIDYLKKNKMTIGGGVGLLLLIYVYFAYFSGGTSATLTTVDNASPLSQDILVTLQGIHDITLDGSIFADPVFVSLSDFGVTIPPQNVGRRNPFAPIGATEKAPAASSTAPKLPGTN